MKTMKQFIDKEKTLHDGVEYYAVGLIIQEFPENTGKEKEITVGFIDPWGEYRHEWRRRDEIIISDISDGDAANLLISYGEDELLEKLCSDKKETNGR